MGVGGVKGYCGGGRGGGQGVGWWGLMVVKVYGGDSEGQGEGWWESMSGRGLGRVKG